MSKSAARTLRLTPTDADSPVAIPSKRSATTPELADASPSNKVGAISRSNRPPKRQQLTQAQPERLPAPRYKAGDWLVAKDRLLSNHAFHIVSSRYDELLKEIVYEATNPRLSDAGVRIAIPERQLELLDYQQGQQIRKEVEGSHVVVIAEVKDARVDDQSGKVTYQMTYKHEIQGSAESFIDVNGMIAAGWTRG